MAIPDRVGAFFIEVKDPLFLSRFNQLCFPDKGMPTPPFAPCRRDFFWPPHKPWTSAYAALHMYPTRIPADLKGPWEEFWGGVRDIEQRIRDSTRPPPPGAVDSMVRALPHQNRLFWVQTITEHMDWEFVARSGLAKREGAWDQFVVDLLEIKPPPHSFNPLDRHRTQYGCYQVCKMVDRLEAEVSLGQATVPPGSPALPLNVEAADTFDFGMVLRRRKGTSPRKPMSDPYYGQTEDEWITDSAVDYLEEHGVQLWDAWTGDPLLPFEHRGEPMNPSPGGRGTPGRPPPDTALSTKYSYEYTIDHCPCEVL